MSETIESLKYSLQQMTVERDALQIDNEGLQGSLDHRLTYSGFSDEALPAPETMTDEQLINAWEYGGEKCKCWHCYWFRYITLLRSQLATLQQQETPASAWERGVQVGHYEVDRIDRINNKWPPYVAPVPTEGK
jgi:hypothetical protein